MVLVRLQEWIAKRHAFRRDWTTSWKNKLIILAILVNPIGGRLKPFSYVMVYTSVGLVSSFFDTIWVSIMRISHIFKY